MKTIDEAVKEIEKVVNGKLATAFIKGVEFANNWNLVEDNPIPIGIVVIVKDVYIPFTAKIDVRNDKLYYYNTQSRNWLETDTKPTHWRYIERH